MTLNDFLKLICGDYVKVTDIAGKFIYDGDKNAIRAYHKELLDEDIHMIVALRKEQFEVRLNMIKGEM